MKEGSETVKVVVRCRPLNSKETADGRERIVEVDAGAGQVLLRNPAAQAGEPPKVFTFDKSFDEAFTQRQIFDETARPIIDSVLEGYNGTIFAYGQTGTGKTHTMEGAPTPEQQGIIPNAFEYIFAAIQASANKQYLVRASFLEIYNEEIRDLLSKSPKDKLELKEHKDSGIYVKGLNAFVVKSVPEIRNVLEVRGLGLWSACAPAGRDMEAGRQGMAAATRGTGCRPAPAAAAAAGGPDRSAAARASKAEWPPPGAAAGGQEEPLGGRHADEPGLLALALHLHHHGGDHRPGRAVGALRPGRAGAGRRAAEAAGWHCPWGWACSCCCTWLDASLRPALLRRTATSAWASSTWWTWRAASGRARRAPQAGAAAWHPPCPASCTTPGQAHRCSSQHQGCGRRCSFSYQLTAACPPRLPCLPAQATASRRPPRSTSRCLHWAT
jgi:hypothetical protein